MMRIRKAVAQDFSAVLELNREIQALHALHEPELFRSADELSLSPEKLGILLHQSEIWIDVAELDGLAVGYIFSEVVERRANPYFKDHKKLYINQLGTKEGYRGRGIGKALLDHTKKRAMGAGISRIEIDVWAFNRDAQAFYERQGFRVHNEKMFLRQ